MNKDIIDNLRHMLEERLSPLISSDYAFIDLPYHPNVGDTLIALAAENFLRSISYRCLYRCSEYTFDERSISPDNMIVFNGGGNFGDLWKSVSEFRNKIIRLHPNNKFLILPQSVCYLDKKNLEEDIRLYSNCGHRITICARDDDSYLFLKRYFIKNNVILVPDMAFYTDKMLLRNQSGNDRVLFLKRRDAEYVSGHKYEIVPDTADIRDWPTMERFMRIHWKYLKYKKLTRDLPWYPKVLLHAEDFIWQKIILPYYLSNGIKFVNKYSVIYSTRLHVAILGVLLGKQVYLFDNSYGKNSSLYNTWLKDLSNIKLV